MVKKFIDKKNATTYKLVYRSQEDPLAFEQGASERVFVQVDRRGREMKKPRSKGKEVEDQTLQQSLRDLQLDTITEQDMEQDEAGRAALYGIYLDDREYDYTKHLRPIGSGGVLLEASTDGDKSDSVVIKDDEDLGGFVTEASSSSAVLPPEVLPSSHRMDIKSEAMPSGIQPYMDHNLREVLEALDDEEVEEFDEEFLDKLNSDNPPSDAEDSDEYGSDRARGAYDDDDDEDFDPEDVFAQVRRMKALKKQQYDSDSDDMDSNDGRGWGGAGTSSTGFSMSSSAMFRNDKLSLLDEHFDKIEAMYENESSDSEAERYDSDGHHIVEYDSDGNAKPISTRPDFESVLDEFLSEYELTGKRMQVVVEGGDGAGKLDTYRDAFLNAHKSKEENRKELLETGVRIAEEDGERTTKQEEEYFDQLFKEKERTPWDCQTILTTYSTLDNHPSVIYEKRTPRIRVSRKTGFPVVENAQEEEEERGDGDEESDKEEEVKENKGKPRAKGETSEEKRARKKMIQEAKRNRREQKKENQGVFAEKRDRKMQSRKDRAQYVIRLD
ncbi:Protein ltv1 [Coemansia sp. RSA 486]|nr:Protein ltv1 [Coemansia sp. RSA 486]KAJ2233668.1 Protein ltv1 [Coemansia sp. RSA 485]KAJ2640187.1 Protein ltv1 [Coemansia sp. RSA 1286]